MLSKILNIIKSYQTDVSLGVCIVLISFISFNLGKISSVQKGDIKVIEGANIYQASSANNLIGDTTVTATTKPKSLDLRVVASKASNSKLYHFTWCSGSKRIKEENQLWFDNEAAAIAAGYKLAGNCLP